MGLVATIHLDLGCWEGSDSPGDGEDEGTVRKASTLSPPGTVFQPLNQNPAGCPRGRAGQGRKVCCLRLPCLAQPVCADLGGWKAVPTPPPPPCSRQDNGGPRFMFCGYQLGEHAAGFVLEVLGGGSAGSPPPA